MKNVVGLFLLVCLCLQPLGVAQTNKPKRGGRLVVSKSVGPRTFNRLLAADDQTYSVTDCLMGALIRVNRQTQQPEAMLARAWKLSRDGKVLTFNLRQGVRFSDGRPFTAEDVIFTFQVLNDPQIASPLADLFNLEGQRVQAQKLDDATVAFNFPAPYAGAVRLFDGVPILPKHILEQPYRAGRFAQIWTLNTPPEQIVGLGPFKLRAFVPGQRVVLARNENYWKTDAAGQPLPYLDELIFSLDPDHNTQLLKFQKGETDLLSPVSADDLATLNALEKQGQAKLYDLGPSLIREVLWFNLNDGKQANGQPLVDPVKLRWFKDAQFRRAISHAIDRQALVNLVFAGKASPQYAFLSAGDKLFYNANVRKYPYDLNRAKSLLADAGFRYDTARQTLLDPRGQTVTFTLITNAGNALRQKISALLQADLAKLGIKVNLAAVESRALLARINESFTYEACLLAVASGDVDPNTHINILFSHGANHWWYPKQARPVTPWEARLDELMKQQAVAVNPAARKRLFDQAQTILAEQQPFIMLASRHLLLAARNGIGNLKPGILNDYLLWNCEELYRR